MTNKTKKIEETIDAETMYAARLTRRDMVLKLEKLEPGSEEWYAQLKNINSFDEVFGTVNTPKKRGVSKEKVLEVGGSLLQVGALLAFESKGHVLTSKAIPFMKKLSF